MKYLAVMIVMAMLLVGGLALAGGSYDVVEDTLLGKNDDCSLLLTPYIAKTFKDAVGKADARVELNYTCDARGITENNAVGIKAGLEF